MARIKRLGKSFHVQYRRQSASRTDAPGRRSLSAAGRVGKAPGDAAGRLGSLARAGGLCPTASLCDRGRAGAAEHDCELRDPADALGARDAQLAAVLAKAGALAARQKQPATIVVTALGQDLPYLNQAIWKGVPAQRTTAVHLENLTAGTSQPYSVTVKTAQSQ